MIKNTIAELDKRVNDLMTFCEENKIPIFVARWNENNLEQNAGYSYACFLPEEKNESNETDDAANKFALFTRAAEGNWRKAGDSL